jgi:5-methylthioadenosine/S-adenosylhomocysteine deaminase
MAEEGAPVVSSHELWTKDGLVDYVGPSKEPSAPFDREIDLGGNLILPGFKNAHTHSAMTFLRSYADDLPLHEWLHQQVFPMEAKLTGEIVYIMSRLAILEYLQSGITANFDMYFHNDDNARASIDSGFRTVFCGAINDFGGTLERDEADFLRFNKLHPLIGYRLGFHGEYTCSREILEGVAALSEKYKAPVYCHNAETLVEKTGSIERHGMTPTVYLDSLGMWNHGGGGFHCVHIDERDMEVMAARGLWAVTNPGSNSKLASGIAPLVEMQKKGVNLAIGTDGPASNNCLDFFKEMFLCTSMQKLRYNDAAAMDGNTVLRMATVGGARAMGLADCDCLAPGKQADLIVIDLSQPNMQPIHNITKNLVYSGSKLNVKLTMIAGKILYEDGKFNVGMESGGIFAKANEMVVRMRGE